MAKEPDKNWWSWDTSIPSHSMDNNKFVWFKKAFFEKSCEEGITVHNTWMNGYVKDKDAFFKYFDNLKGAKVISSSIGIRVDDDEGYTGKIAAFPHGLVEVETHHYDEGSYRVNITSIDKTFFDKTIKGFEKFLTKVPPDGDIKMLVNGAGGGYDFASIGRLNRPIIKGNYTSTVVEGYNHIIEEIGSSDPCGRFILLNGDPGTGKSFFIRGLISSASAWFVFIPSAMVGALSGPNLVSLLLDNAEERSGLPIVLIIEDADSSLVTRESTGDMNQISDLLNIGDGLLGELADIRIIATTNARITNIDKAILRPGRLCKKIEFATLKLPKAKAIFTKLTGSEEGFSSATTLAEVYKMAREAGWKPSKIQVMNGSGGNYV